MSERSKRNWSLLLKIASYIVTAIAGAFGFDVMM